MIDLHSHLLYGVDDGAKDFDESLRLASIAVADGITHVVLTPHIHPERYPNVKSTLIDRFESFQSKLIDEGLPLSVSLAGEVRFGLDSLDLLHLDEIPFYGIVGGYRVMLLEFPHQMIPSGSERYVEKLISMGIRPLIAHPERNKSVMARPEKIFPFVQMGCWLQLTSGSISGRFGPSAQKTAQILLENKLAWVIATDAHNVNSRPPLLAEGREAAARIVGEQEARLMVEDRPSEIISGLFQCH